jgi:hypothetical protein
LWQFWWGWRISKRRNVKLSCRNFTSINFFAPLWTNPLQMNREIRLHFYVNMKRYFIFLFLQDEVVMPLTISDLLQHTLVPWGTISQIPHKQGFYLVFNQIGQLI